MQPVTWPPACRPRQQRDHVPEPLLDDRERRLDYLRLSTTDLCNLRCRYCLPAEGLPLANRSHLLSWEEMLRLCDTFVGLGVRKIRLTGGEPLARRGLIEFLERLAELPGGPELLLTTNGTLLAPHLERLWACGVRRLNISLDSLQDDCYRRITRRDGLARVLAAIHRADALGFGLKINTVLLAGINDRELEDFVALTRDHAWTVRFIEPMPFDGRGGEPSRLISGEEILGRLLRRHDLTAATGNHRSVDELYSLSDHQGRVGIIRGYSRTFCARCSRLRVSAQGQLRTCLYGQPVLDLRALLRDGVEDRDIRNAIAGAVRSRHADGHAAQASWSQGNLRSMSRIGG